MLPLLAAVGGCGPLIWKKESKVRPDLGVPVQSVALANSAAFRDTIAAKTFYEGTVPMHVRGYGLVVGLAGKGSRDCPRNIRERLIQDLYKQHHFTTGVVGERGTTPEAIIHSMDSAVVGVRAAIPAAAKAGQHFDVAVMALPGTETKALTGGRLVATDLHVFRRTSAQSSLSGRVLARAMGPLFSNPFARGKGAATQANPLEATILGGGVALEDRRVRLVLTKPSYRWARRIRDRINAQFPADAPIADATSPSFVRLRIPEEYRDDQGHFLALVRALYLSHDPQFCMTRARALGKEILQPSADHARIALCLEGLGRDALPVLSELYSHSREDISFHAAVAGLRIGDHLAGDAMGLHAQNPNSQYRYQAIRALGEAKGMAGTAMVLRDLLEDEDPRVAIAAYEALIKRGDPTIASRLVGRDNFILDHIPSDRHKFVYVKRSGSRRIAVFGNDLRCEPPLLYRSPDGGITLTANPGDTTLTALRVALPSGSVSPPIPVPYELLPLLEMLGRDVAIGPDNEVLGLGVDYAAIVRALYHLCEDDALDANFTLEQPNVAELFGPPRPQGRPESEL